MAFPPRESSLLLAMPLQSLSFTRSSFRTPSLNSSKSEGSFSPTGTAGVRAKLSSNCCRARTGRFHSRSLAETLSAIHIPKSKHMGSSTVKLAAIPGKMFFWRNLLISEKKAAYANSGSRIDSE